MNFNSSPSASEQVLQATLVLVRRKRQARQRRRAAVVALTVLAALWGAARMGWDGQETPQAGISGVQVKHETPAVREVAPLPATLAALPGIDDERGWAVVVMRDGTPSLEERRSSELADVDLKFSLDPLIAHSSY